MGKESLISGDRRCIFRECFTPESISRNGGVLFGSGSVSTNGRLSVTHDVAGGITYAHNPISDNSFTLRIKALIPSYMLSQSGYEHYARHHQSGLGYGLVTLFGALGSDYLRFMLGNGNRFTYTTSLAPYMDDKYHDIVCVYDSDTLGNSKIYVDGNDLTNHAMSGGSVYTEIFRIGNNHGDAYTLGTTYELVEIYQGALSPEEISLLNTDSLYRGYCKEGLVLDCDYTQGTGMNRADPTMTPTEANTEYGHGLGLMCDNVRYLHYGTDSNFVLGTNDFTIEVVASLPVYAYDAYTTFMNEGNIVSLVDGVWGLGVDNTGGPFESIIRFAERDSLGSSNILTKAVSDGFHHIVVVGDVTNSHLYMYIDGVETNDSAYGSPINKNVSYNLAVGALYRPPSGTRYFRTQMPMARLYNGNALTAEEVRQNYQYAVDRGWVNG